MLREHAFDPSTQRRLFSLEIAAPTALPRFEIPSRHFACLLAWDARRASHDKITSLAERLLVAGASYFVCWGPDCERVHDIIDETLGDAHDRFGITIDARIMTTWHASEPLREALWFFLVCSWPDDRYAESTQAALAISIGSPAWAVEIAEALDHPREFVRHGESWS